jgi:hypothetical protein
MRVLRLKGQFFPELLKRQFRVEFSCNFNVTLLYLCKSCVKDSFSTADFEQYRVKYIAEDDKLSKKR